MGYIKITRGNRYKGFDYKVSNWNDLETLTNDAQNMVKGILESIKALPSGEGLGGAIVTRNPAVTQATGGLRKAQKANKKQAVTHDSEKIADSLNK